MNDEHLRVWRLMNNGNAVFGYRGLVFKFYSGNNSDLDKYDCLHSILPSNVTSSIFEVFLSRINNDSDAVIITRKGMPLSLLNDIHMLMLADALKSLHQVINPDKIPSVLENKMLSNGKYDPIIIWRSFYLPALNSVGCNSKSIAEKIFEKLTLVIGNVRSPCLIHGDLHYGNVVVLDEKVKIFDWSNARLDTPLIDLASFVISAKLSLKRTNVFLSRYDPEINIEDLYIPMFFSILWTALYMKDNKIYSEGALHWCNQLSIFNALTVFFA